MTFADSFIEQDSPAKMYAAAGVDAAHIVATVAGVMGVERTLRS